MSKNMGTVDRWTRFGLAAVLLVLYFTNTVSGVLATIFLIVAGIYVVTSIIGWCPLYAPFKFSTLVRKKEPE